MCDAKEQSTLFVLALTPASIHEIVTRHAESKTGPKFYWGFHVTKANFHWGFTALTAFVAVYAFARAEGVVGAKDIALSTVKEIRFTGMSEHCMDSFTRYVEAGSRALAAEPMPTAKEFAKESREIGSRYTEDGCPSGPVLQAVEAFRRRESAIR